MTNSERGQLIIMLRSLLKIDNLEIIKFTLESLIEKLEESESVSKPDNNAIDD